MRFQYVFPGSAVPVTALLSAQALTEQAVAAERAGFAAVGMDDHPALPQAWRMTPSGHDGLDPFLTLAAVAAATREIRLSTFLAVLPYRNPFQFARLVATLNVLSGGREKPGLGAGYLPGEFAALGSRGRPATRSSTSPWRSPGARGRGTRSPGAVRGSASPSR